ncbi:hypothetical protein HZF08_17605 [Paenibacillus sp. CGMCC 1.16610]|uniref:Uncharacterized protein n=1 Tax=Paenibacillus anseongense TaxID=2682845 RepID=A0ABW9UGZ1_9BACL|nr:MULTISPECIES: hypothetical protein [Paenibacillus]MBA2940133.1 hypothetical protein [Paenibacillus sp. CGMCC 1.16610]MVQ38587.1 hypothetical protein [Paenibacillus anseongense]
MKTQWKRRASQASLLAFMVTMAFGAVGSASAADTTTTDTKASTAITSATPIMATSAVQLGTSSSGLLLQPAHERNYLKLLVSNYAPESLADWKQALEDRKQAESEMPKPAFSKTMVIKSAATIQPATQGTLETKMFKLDPAQPAPTLPDGEAAQLVPSKELKTFTIIKKDGADATATIQALPLEGTAISGDIIKAEPSEAFKRQQKLAEAVEVDDAATIQSLLPELLTDYKKETESLRSLAKTLKEQAAKADEKSTEKTEESN